MTAQLGRVGNASSLHASGRDARRVVEESRETIARALGCRPGEVVFTSGGTESDNLAVKGLFWARRAEDPRRTRILSTPIEHHAVLDPLHWLGRRGRQGRAGRRSTTWAGSTSTRFRAAVERDPGASPLVTVMWANNEVGTVQPIAEVVEIAARPRHPGAHRRRPGARPAAASTSPRSGVDAMTVTGHKIGGPYGVGALVVRRELQPTALLHGGGQERDIRSGTIDAAGDRRLRRGRASSPSSVSRSRPRGSPRCATTWCAGVRREVPDAIYNGDPELGPEHRLPGNAHLDVPRLRGRLAADAARRARHRVLDRVGLLRPACRRPRTCCSRWARSDEVARSSLRFSLGHTSTAGRRRRAGRGDRPGRRARPGRRLATGLRPGTGSDASPRSDVRRRRLGRRRCACRRGGPRRHRHPPRAVAQPEVLPHRRPRLLHDRGRQRRPPGCRRDRHPVLRLGPERALPRGRGRGLPRASTPPAARPTRACAATRRSSSPPCSTGRSRSASTRWRPATTPSCAPAPTG